jgi:hypothetical protein
LRMTRALCPVSLYSRLPWIGRYGVATNAHASPFYLRGPQLGQLLG